MAHEQDRFVFIRCFAGIKVVVTAERLSQDDLWALQVRRNGDLIEHVTSDDVFHDAEQAIQAAFIEASELETIAVDEHHVA